MKNNKWLNPLSVLTTLFLIALTMSAKAQDEYEREPINYLKAKANDPISQLQGKLDRGEVQLKFEPHFGYLRSVLKLLDIPASSQGLVFSKTSFQRSKIGPESPRAVYFQDDIYLGYVHEGDFLEISAVDPQLGGIYYALDQTQMEKPKFRRMTHDCLSCHATSRTQDVPGHLVRSVFVDPRGNPIFNAGGFTTEDSSPFSERWGGWYVTGAHGQQRHMGNVIVQDPDKPEAIDREKGANLKDLSKHLNTKSYLEPTSDIVALMVLEHQTQMHNALTRANHEGRQAQYYQEGINKSFGEPQGTLYDSAKRRFDNAAELVIKRLLFVEEAPLTDKVVGSSTFSKDFPARGPKDSQGRSLRDFDLEHRLFRYPCSYLIHSKAFDALPKPVLDRIAQRLDQILLGKSLSPEFSHLSNSDRAAIRKILMETKPTLTEGWNSSDKPK